MIDMQDTVRRSWLLVPLSDENQISQAWTVDADVLVLDLAELVAEVDKPPARERAREAIADVRRGGAHVFVQVDKELLYADLRACAWPGLDGIIIPRLESAQEVAEADDLLSAMEDERGLPPGRLQIVASLETDKGNFYAMDIARSCPRIWGITLGRADLMMDLRPEPSGEIHLMTYLMQRMITIANACGIVPLGAWWRAPARGLLASPEDTYQAAIRGSHIGFKGSMCIRGDQVEQLNRGFSPGEDAIGEARHLADAFAKREAAGETVMSMGGRIVDLPAARAARKLIEFAGACAARDEEKSRAVSKAQEELLEQGASP